MVEVEDTAHEEEGQVMETPAQEQPASSSQETVYITCGETQANDFLKTSNFSAIRAQRNV